MEVADVQPVTTGGVIAHNDEAVESTPTSNTSACDKTKNSAAGENISSDIKGEEISRSSESTSKDKNLSASKTSQGSGRKMKSSPEHRERLLAQLARGRETARRNRESGNFILPLRNIKRIMRLNEDVGMVQNEAAVLVQAAAELFTKQFAVDSLNTAKSNGRKNTIKYEDVAETRSSNERLSFLEPLLP